MVNCWCAVLLIGWTVRDLVLTIESYELTRVEFSVLIVWTQENINVKLVSNQIIR